MFNKPDNAKGRNVYLVSHGDIKTYIGEEDHMVLSDDGFEQAEILEKRCVELQPDLIISSQTPCAKETARIVNKSLRVPMEESNLLIQRRMPKEFIKQQANPLEAERIKQQMREYHKLGKRYSDEETFDELKVRVMNAFNQIIASRRESSILIVSHLQTLRALLGIILLKEKFTLEMFITLDQVTQPVNTGITWCNDSGKGWKLLAWNDHAHLGGGM